MKFYDNFYPKGRGMYLYLPILFFLIFQRAEAHPLLFNSFFDGVGPDCTETPFDPHDVSSSCEYISEDCSAISSVTFMMSADVSLRLEKVTEGITTHPDTVHFRIIVTNNGPDPVTSVTVADTVPTDLGFVANSPTFEGNDGWADFGGMSYQQTIASLSPGQDTVLNIYLQVASGASVDDVGNIAEIISVEDDQGMPIMGFGNNTRDILWAYLVAETMSSKETVNVSLSELCNNDPLHVDMLLSQRLYPVEAYRIVVKDGNTEIPNSFSRQHIGKTYVVEVHNRATGNMTWLYVNIEYKYKPTIDCSTAPPTLIVSCGTTDADLEMLGLPDVSSNCVETKLNKIYDVTEKLPNDPNYIASRVRRWRAEGANGKFSDDICEQVVLYERANVNNILWPRNFTMLANNPLQCNNDADPLQDFNITGVPEYNIVNIDFSRGQNLGARRSYGLDIADIDGNDSVDVFFAIRGAPNHVWYGSVPELVDSTLAISSNQGSYDVELGDLNGDGNLDAFVTTFSGTNKIWLRGVGDGNRNFVPGQIFSAGSQRTSVSLGDIDNDGDLDAVLGLYGGQNQVWINDGIGNFSFSANLGADSDQSRDIMLVDLTGEGDIDIFVANYNATYEVWINDGSGTFQEETQTYMLSGIRGIDVGDVDRDGDMDIITAGVETSNRVLFNDGNGVFSLPDDLSSDELNSLETLENRDVALGDIDNDGDLDAIFSGRGSIANELWLNDGHGVFTNSGITVGAGNTREVKLGDIDNDGDLDVIFAVRGGSNSVYLNNTMTTVNIPLYSNAQMADLCHIMVTYEDKYLTKPEETCVKKVRRLWTIYDWQNGNTIEHAQMLDVVDNMAPVIAMPLEDMVVSTNGGNCSASIPLPLPVVSDNCSSTYINVTVSGLGYYERYDGNTNVDLALGDNEVIYNVYDDCLNLVSDTINVRVEDNAGPTVVCIQNSVVSLNTVTREAYLHAKAVGRDSYDACNKTNMTYEIARMSADGTTGPFSERLRFTCNDAATNGGQVMVVLRVTDHAGNSGQCMVEVQVQDKASLSMRMPADRTVGCENIDLAALQNKDDLSGDFGAVTVSNLCSPYTLHDTIYADGKLNPCGIGTLERRVILFIGNTPQDTGYQKINVINNTPSVMESEITWPTKDTTVDVTSIPTDTKTIDAGKPVLPTGSCRKLLYGFEDFTDPAGNPAVFKRVWKVIDWCETDETKDGHVNNPFTYYQVITLNITGAVAVTITPPRSGATYQNSGDCNAGLAISIGLAATATGNVMSSSYTVTDSDGDVVASGNGLDAAGTYVAGEYTVTYTVIDVGGVQHTASTTFEVENTAIPEAYCHNINVGIGKMTIDGVDSAGVSVNVGRFVSGYANGSCFQSVQLSYASDRVVTDTLFTCKDTAGINKIQIYFTAASGAQNSCISDLNVMDNSDACDPTTTRLVDVSGAITTQQNAAVSNVRVALRGADTANQMTDGEGAFAFPSMSVGGNYEVNPYKNDDLINGVNTLDLVRIQRHILDVKKITNAYDLIAADINNDKRIKATDLLALRKVILGISDEFPNNTSWRFVDAGYIFKDKAAAHSESFTEKYPIRGLDEDMNIDFVGIKIGDIDGNAITTRSDNSFDFVAEDIQLENGSTYEIAIKAGADATLYGLQSALDIHDVDIVDVHSGALDIATTDFVVFDGELRLSVAEPTGVEVRAGETLFTLSIEANSTEYVSRKINIGKYLVSEAYLTDELTPHDIDLRWSGENNTLRVLSNNPNPWQSSTYIDISTPRVGNVQLIVTDVQGRLVHSRSDYFRSGSHTLTLTSEQVGVSGMLLYEIRQGDDVVRGKLIRLE